MICSENQLTSFYMIGTLAFNELEEDIGQSTRPEMDLEPYKTSMMNAFGENS